MHWLLLDLAGVLATFDPDSRLRRLGHLAGLAPAVVHDRLWGSGLVAAADRGELTAVGVRDAVRDRLELGCSDAELDAAWASAFTVDARVLAVVADSGVDPERTGILTNNDALLADVLPSVLPEVFARARGGSFFAGAIGAAKPDPAAWQAVLDTWAVEAADVCFVDDSAGHVRAAAELGFDAVLFNSADSLARDLRGRT